MKVVFTFRGGTKIRDFALRPEKARLDSLAFVDHPWSLSPEAVVWCSYVYGRNYAASHKVIKLGQW